MSAVIGPLTLNLMRGTLHPPRVVSRQRTRPGRDGVRVTIQGERYIASQLLTHSFHTDATAADNFQKSAAALIPFIFTVTDSFGVSYSAVRILGVRFVRQAVSTVVGAGALPTDTIMLVGTWQVQREL